MSSSPLRALLIIVIKNNALHIRTHLDEWANLIHRFPGIEILLLDDASNDGTQAYLHAWHNKEALIGFHVVLNHYTQGYGGNLKVGFRHAIENEFEWIVTFACPSSPSPQALDFLLNRLQEQTNEDCILASSKRRPIIHQFLSWFHNGFVSKSLANWHAPLRAYHRRCISSVAYEFNAQDAQFDTELLLQLLDQKATIRPLAIPDVPLFENNYFRGFTFARDVLKSSFKYWLQRFSLFYDIRFHPEAIPGLSTASPGIEEYHEKLECRSPHSFVCRYSNWVPRNSRVLDIGCSTGYVAQALATTKKCKVTGIDQLPLTDFPERAFTYIPLDLEKELDRLNTLLDHEDFDVVLMLDVLEHLSSPEIFLMNLSRRKFNNPPTLILSTGNVAFCIVRLMLLLGHFNYGQKGILDINHKRLFSWRTFKNLLDQTGFHIIAKQGFPFPYRELGLPKFICGFLEKIHNFLILIRPSLFSYQVLFVAKPIYLPPLPTNPR